MDKMKIDLNNRKFKSVYNSSNGEVGGETIFFYNQTDDIIYADYYGGDIIKGQLIGKVVDVNTKKEVMTGNCRSFPETDKDGSIILNEVWQWTCKDGSKGESTLKETAE